MGGHRHATDRVDGMCVAECPNGCAAIELEYSDTADNTVLEDLKKLAETCASCGAEMDIIQYEEPSEVLN